MNISYVWNKLNIFKNRNSRKNWRCGSEEEQLEITSREMCRVAPCWTEERPLLIRSMLETNGTGEANRDDSHRGMGGPFNRDELDRAINSCRDKSSPRLDGIEYDMIKRLTDRFKRELLERLNFAFLNNRMFEDWKEIQTIFIPKKDRGKVRPISMSSCVGKVLERMINDRINWLAEKNK